MSDISSILFATMSPDPRTRIEAEISLADTFTQPQTGLILAQISVSPEMDVSLRQSAAIALRKYVREYWAPGQDGYKGPAAPPDIQEQIRQIIFKGLADPQQKIRALSATVISTCAKSDFPARWPTLLDNLLAYLSSGDPSQVHGAMTVLSELVRAELSEDQTIPMLQRMLPVLLNVLGAGEVYSGPTRARAVHVFSECLRALEMLKSEYPKQIKSATEQILPTWLSAFQHLLQSDPTQEIDKDAGGDLAMRTQIFMTLSTVCWTFPRFISPVAQDFFMLGLSHLNALYPNFHDEYLLSSGSGLEIPVPGFLDDDTVACGPQLASPILDFMSSQIRVPRMKQWLEGSGIGEVLGVVVRWIQMTTDDEEAWMGDINLFVNDEDDEADTYSIRLSGLELVDELFEDFPVHTPRVLAEIVQSSINAAQQDRVARKEEWWKPIEAGLAILANKPTADAMMIAFDDNVIPTDQILWLLRDVLPALCSNSHVAFLQGRALIFAGRYHKLADDALARDYVNATLGVLESEGVEAVAKVSAVRAIQAYSYNASLTLPFAERITVCLAPLLTQTTEDTLSQVLETLNAVVGLDGGKWMSDTLAGQLGSGLLHVLDENAKDMIFVSVLSNMFETLASSPYYVSVVRETLPRLAQTAADNAVSSPNSSVPAIDLITSLIRGCKLPNGLGEGFVDMVVPALTTCILTAEDRDLVGSAVVCLTHVVRKDCPQILRYHNPQGQTGLQIMIQVLAHVLRPQESEAGGLWIGDLVVHLLRRAGDEMAAVLPDLLISLVTRLPTVKTAPFIQSLVIPFAYIMQSHRDFVLDLLEKTPVHMPDGSVKSGVEVLLRSWTDTSEAFQGHWANRISDLGLCQLFLSGRSSVLSVPCQGSLIIKPEQENIIITRSKSKQMPIEYTSIPFPVKAMKIILGDITTDAEPASAGVKLGIPTGTDDDDDEDADDWADEETVYQERVKDDEFAFLSENWDDEDDFPDDVDDEDLKEDPVSKMDMQAYLFAFLRDCAQKNTNNFARIVDELNVEEQMTLQRALSG
ncbi:ARM repeat-containing protein [Calocera cornea HHB12733]|uniref:ARM repeat-containing protein n=1 Tax=Calocera cornea HHB12733 TaxID=1353952 RepID=A0A165DIP3_9BASI|nr:ARM repeat-containing protein [Calocera cornea HHB12733]